VRYLQNKLFILLLSFTGCVNNSFNTIQLDGLHTGPVKLEAGPNAHVTMEMDLKNTSDRDICLSIRSIPTIFYNERALPVRDVELKDRYSKDEVLVFSDTSSLPITRIKVGQIRRLVANIDLNEYFPNEFTPRPANAEDLLHAPFKVSMNAPVLNCSLLRENLTIFTYKRNETDPLPKEIRGSVELVFRMK